MKNRKYNSAYRNSSIQIHGVELNVLTDLDSQGQVVETQPTQLRWLVLFLTFSISMLATV